MNVRNVAALTLGLVVIVSLLTVWFYPSVEDYMHTNPFWNGLRDFSGEFDVEWSQSLGSAAGRPAGTMLIEIPYSSYGEGDLARISEYVESGGLLLLADDYGYGNSVLQALGLEARFSGSPLLDPLFCEKNQRLPRVTDFAEDVSRAGIESLVLNHATALLEVDSDAVLARSSGSSYLDLNGNGARDDDEPERGYATASVHRVGDGTVVLLSDPSILINSMVDRDDNRAFVRYLRETYGSGRTLVADVSRLPSRPLDNSKRELDDVRDRISHPYSVMVMLGVVILGVMRPWQRKEAA